MYSFLRSLLFLLNPERAHYSSVNLIKFTLRLPILKWLIKSSEDDLKLSRRVFGIDFPNPIGLAAGFDKDASCFEEMGQLGFGFIEIGTVTPLPQEGNPKPRLFRLKKDFALINRMGFNNQGVVAAADRLKKRNKESKLIVGGNIGKNKWTPNDQAVQDYIQSFNALFPYVDYFAVNVSSPNTVNLRQLQEKEPLMYLLNELKLVNVTYPNPKPILLKIAPDLSTEQLDDIVDIAKELPLDGIIATNTTISREGLRTDEKQLNAIGQGGLSGVPVAKRSTEVIRYLNTKLEGKIPIVGVGGIHSKEDALEKLDAGATLIQLYTGFIYEGPSLIKAIKKAILARG